MRKEVKILPKVILAFLFVFSIWTSAISRVRFVPMEDLPALADFVIAGKVLDAPSRWDQRGVTINTDYTISVEENIVGLTPPKIVMSFAGGTVDGKTITVSETPVLEIWKTYILFAYEGKKYSVPVVGHEQGVFQIVYDTATGQNLIVDYNWYRIEMTQERKVIRGALTELDAKGALISPNVETKEKGSSGSKPVVKDAQGREIPQECGVFEKPKTRQHGAPMKKSEFIDFIKAQAHNKRVQNGEPREGS